MAVKAYQMHVEGFVPGLPGVWPAGSVVVVDENEETGEVKLVNKEVEAKVEALEAQIEEVEHDGQ